jgi:hypothetical protein
MLTDRQPNTDAKERERRRGDADTSCTETEEKAEGEAGRAVGEKESI